MATQNPGDNNKKLIILTIVCIAAAIIFWPRTESQSTVPIISSPPSAAPSAYPTATPGTSSSDSPRLAETPQQTVDEYANAPSIIKTKCAEDWPDDFRMRAYCEKQQREGLTTLKKGKPSDISDSEYRTIHKKCASDWENDFRMRAYCEKKQFDAIRELRQ